MAMGTVRNPPFAKGHQYTLGLNWFENLQLRSCMAVKKFLRSIPFFVSRLHMVDKWLFPHPKSQLNIWTFQLFNSPRRRLCVRWLSLYQAQLSISRSVYFKWCSLQQKLAELRKLSFISNKHLRQSIDLKLFHQLKSSEALMVVESGMKNCPSASKRHQLGWRWRPQLEASTATHLGPAVGRTWRCHRRKMSWRPWRFMEVMKHK